MSVCVCVDKEIFALRGKSQKRKICGCEQKKKSQTHSRMILTVHTPQTHTISPFPSADVYFSKWQHLLLRELRQRRQEREGNSDKWGLEQQTDRKVNIPLVEILWLHAGWDLIGPIGVLQSEPVCSLSLPACTGVTSEADNCFLRMYGCFVNVICGVYCMLVNLQMTWLQHQTFRLSVFCTLRDIFWIYLLNSQRALHYQPP